MDINNLDIAEWTLRAIAVVLSLTIHEYSHALVSTLQGDDTPSLYGRLTLNPLKHLDVMGLIALMLFSFGWAKPVPVSTENYKNRRLGMILTSVAGPISNLILATASAFVLLGLQPENDGVYFFLVILIYMNISLAIFNIIPFPPLDGSKIFGGIFGGAVERAIYRIDRAGVFILFLILSIPMVNDVFFSIISYVANIILRFAATILL